MEQFLYWKENQFGWKWFKSIMVFLTLFHKQGFSYSSINTAKSTLMTFVTVNNSSSWSSDQDLNRFLKGIYNSKPPMPRYSTTWDVNIILNFLANWMPLEDLTLKELTLKTVTWIALVSGNSAQSIHEMKLNRYHEAQNQMVFYFGCKLKTSNPHKKVKKFSLNKFQDNALCVVYTLKQYIKVTENIKKGNQLWLSWIKPHEPVDRQTISRWLKQN